MMMFGQMQLIDIEHINTNIMGNMLRMRCRIRHGIGHGLLYTFMEMGWILHRVDIVMGC